MISIEIKKGKELSKYFIKLFDRLQQKEFKSKQIKDFSKYNKDIFFILKDNREIVSFGKFKLLKIRYAKRDYNILGIANVISIQKKKGYGKKLIKIMINYAKKRNKTIIGFCQKQNPLFYKKCGIVADKQLLKRLLYKNSINKDEDYVIYLGGKDKFIQRIISTKSKIKLDTPFW